MRRSNPAILAIEGLCSEAANIVQGAKMQQEQQGADRYDPGALAVDTSVPFDSETGFEDRG